MVQSRISMVVDVVEEEEEVKTSKKEEEAAMEEEEAMITSQIKRALHRSIFIVTSQAML